MKRLRRKLHSQSGAALLLAFLLLLLCIMVASSILAAAASNAGKIKSNRIEQQKYMTLTSAVQLICDDLEKAKYTAEYDKYEWKVEEDGTEYFHIKLYSGTYTDNSLTDQIPLGKWLNHILFGEYKNREGYDYSGLTGVTADPTYTCNLEVTLPDGLKGYPYKTASSPQAVYQVDQTVTVKVEINDTTHNITLTAWLGGEDYDPNDPVKVTAELAAKKVPSPFINPHGTGSNDLSYSGLPTPGYTNQTYTVTGVDDEGNEKIIATFTTIKKETLTSMTWKLNWIKKGE